MRKSDTIELSEIAQELFLMWGFIPYEIKTSAPSINRFTTEIAVECKNCNHIINGTFQALEALHEEGRYCPECNGNTSPAESYMPNVSAKTESKYVGALDGEFAIMSKIQDEYEYRPYDFISIDTGVSVVLRHKPCFTEFKATPEMLFDNREVEDLYIPGELIKLPYCPKCNNVFATEHKSLSGIRFVERLHNYFNAAGKDFPYEFAEDDLSRFKDYEVKFVVTCKHCKTRFPEVPSALFDFDYKSHCPVCKGNPDNSDIASKSVQEAQNEINIEKIEVSSNPVVKEQPAPEFFDTNTENSYVPEEQSFDSGNAEFEDVPVTETENVSEFTNEQLRDVIDSIELVPDEEPAIDPESPLAGIVADITEELTSGVESDESFNREISDESEFDDEYAQAVADNSGVLYDESSVEFNTDPNIISVEDQSLNEDPIESVVDSPISVEVEPQYEYEEQSIVDENPWSDDSSNSSSGYPSEYEPTSVNIPTPDFVNPEVVNGEFLEESESAVEPTEETFDEFSESMGEILEDMGFEPTTEATLLPDNAASDEDYESDYDAEQDVESEEYAEKYQLEGEISNMDKYSGNMVLENVGDTQMSILDIFRPRQPETKIQEEIPEEISQAPVADKGDVYDDTFVEREDDSENQIETQQDIITEEEPNNNPENYIIDVPTPVAQLIVKTKKASNNDWQQGVNWS